MLTGNHPNLVIQITVTGSHKTGQVGTGFRREGTHQRIYAIGWTGAPPASGSQGMAALKFEVSMGQANLQTFGVGCRGTAGVPTMTMTGDGKLGGNAGVDVANCPNTTPVFHAFGLTRYRVPIDIAMILVSSFSLAWLWPHVRAGVRSAILDGS